MNKAAPRERKKGVVVVGGTVGTIGKNENFIWQKSFLEMYL